MPPLAASRWPPAVWRDVLRQLATTLGPRPGCRARHAAALAAADDEQLEELADAACRHTGSRRERRRCLSSPPRCRWCSPRSPGSSAPASSPLDAPGVCPCCGSLPVASIVRLGAAINNLRYLHCSLCNTEWNLPRAKCTACDTDQGVALHEVEGSKAPCAPKPATVQELPEDRLSGEGPDVDPVADDLATLTLDMLVDEAGYQRPGPNLLLFGAQSG